MIGPLVESTEGETADKLHTLVEHIALETRRAISLLTEKGHLSLPTDKMLVSGGGAFNQFLISRIQHHVPMEVVVPDERMIKFKEALLMSLLGAQRLAGEVNVFASVTGATVNTVGGAVYWGDNSLP